MVIKSKIYDFLKKNLGEYLYGFEKNQLDVGLLSGHIELVNVNFRPDKVNELLGSLGFPVQIKAGLIGKLKFKCHYTSFLSSPMEVELDELLLVFGPITHIYREQQRLQEVDDETFMWQFEMEQQILNYNKNKQQQIYISDISQNDFENPKKKKNKHKHRHKHKGEEEDGNENNDDTQSKHKKKRKHGERTIEESSSKKHSEEKSSRRHKSKGEEIETSDYKNNEFKYESNNHSRNNTKNPKEEGNNQEEPKKKGFLEKYFTKVLKNLSLTVKSVHVIYEDETYPYLNPLALGFSFEKLEVKNISHEWFFQNNKFLKRQPRKNSTVKEIAITKLGIYIYSMASVVIPTSLWEATIHSEIGIFEAFPAYEVRELIIQQSEMLSNSHPSTFIQPTNGKLCITLNDDAPVIKVVGVVERVDCVFTSAMAECMRNFFDYCTNVQIWPLISRHRPEERIPERPEKREHRKERRKRREIVRNWFQYAFTFAKFKKAAIRYMRERKKERENYKKLEIQEKIRVKILESKEKVSNSAPVVPEPSKNASLFSTNKNRKLPGTAAIKLDEMVKDYNTKKPLPLVPQKKLSKRPYDGEQYFSKTLQNSELEFHLGNFYLKIIDEDTDLSLEFSSNNTILVMNTLLDEMAGLINFSDFSIGLKNQGKTTEILNSDKNKASGAIENAVKINFTYRPAEIIIPNDIYACLNMYEIKCEIAPVNFVYTHNTLNHFFLIKESFELDKVFRENLNVNFIKAFAKRCKRKNMPKVFGIELKRLALAKKVALSLVEFQKKIEEKIIELNQKISPILMDISVDIEGGKVNFHDFSPNSLLFVTFPRLKLEAGKTKEMTFLNALGINLQTESTPSALYDFISTLLNIFCEKLKQIKICTSFKKIN